MSVLGHHTTPRNRDPHDWQVAVAGMDAEMVRRDIPASSCLTSTELRAERRGQRSGQVAREVRTAQAKEMRTTATALTGRDGRRQVRSPPRHLAVAYVSFKTRAVSTNIELAELNERVLPGPDSLQQSGISPSLRSVIRSWPPLQKTTLVCPDFPHPPFHTSWPPS